MRHELIAQAKKGQLLYGTPPTEITNAGPCDCGHSYADHDKTDSEGNPLACNKCGCDSFHQVSKKNAAEHTDTCDFCGEDYQCSRIKHDVLKCPACGGPSTMIKNSSRPYQIGDRVDVHDEVGTIVKVKDEGASYLVRFHYGTVEVLDTDIEGISSHIENTMEACPCENCAKCNAGELEKCSLCGHAHNGDVCDDCDCRIFKGKE